MADIKVELNGDDVNRAIADAIVKSTLGEVLTKMVNDYVRGLTTSYDNPVKKLIENEVKVIIVGMVHERMPQIREAVATQLTAELTDKFVTASVEKMLKSIY